MYFLLKFIFFFLLETFYWCRVVVTLYGLMIRALDGVTVLPFLLGQRFQNQVQVLRILLWYRNWMSLQCLSMPRVRCFNSDNYIFLSDICSWTTNFKKGLLFPWLTRVGNCTYLHRPSMTLANGDRFSLKNCELLPIGYICKILGRCWTSKWKMLLAHLSGRVFLYFYLVMKRNMSISFLQLVIYFYIVWDL